MPLQENPNLANQPKAGFFVICPEDRQLLTSIQAQRHSVSLKSITPNTSILNVMKTRSRARLSTPVALKPQQSNESLVATTEKVLLESLNDFESDPPKLTVDDVELSLNMAQVNGLFKEQSLQSSEPSRPGRVISASMMRSAALPTTEPTTTSDSAWSSAIGHASTGKSGRVIEKLQAEIDRLRRENQLVKVQFDEVEKANETLATRNQYLQDRNSNYESSHEANLRQLDRKERQVQDLRDELKREKDRTARAEERVRLATTNEETWKDHANQAKAIAQQKEVEYNTIAACRTTDNDRYQGGLDKIKANFSVLMQQRQEDVEKHKKLQIIAEQQRKTIQQLEQLTQKLNANFKAYRSEIDAAIEGLRENAGANDESVNKKLREMEAVTGQMKWIVNVEQIVNHKQGVLPPTLKHENEQDETLSQDPPPSSPLRKAVNSIDPKSKQAKKKSGKPSKS